MKKEQREAIFNIYDVEGIMQFIEDNNDKGSFVSIQIKSEYSKRTLYTTLKANSHLPTSITVEDCRFDFEKDEYVYKKKRVHLTRGEKLFLYDYLILHDNDVNRRFLYQMRKRFGVDFLSVLNVRRRK